MKKFLAILLLAMMLTVLFCTPYVLAEALESPASPAVPAPVTYTINLTGLIIAILVAFFEFLLAWLLKAVIPPAKRWLESHTTKNQQQILWNVVMRLVEAAEQTITGLNRGSDRMQYVQSRLKAHGYEVDTYLIEAAVKEMNDKMIGVLAHALELGGDDESADDDLEGDETE